jgi:2-polyprenyl-6-methoxyphenol hydroxylase-like FAD-dependent oxidoreductase
MTKHALIIGGGIAGPLTAMALQRAGVETDVYEEYGRGSDGVGAFLTLAVNGMEALRALGLYDLVRDLGTDTPKMDIINARGRLLASTAQPSRTLKRADLYQALRDEAVRRGVRIHYGKRLDDASSTARGVAAHFADGGTAEGDLLIGADGLRSRTRTLIDPNAPRAQHIGLLNTGGYAKGVSVPGEPGTMYFIFGRRCFFGYLIHPNGEVWWFANPPSQKEPTREELAAAP